VIRCRVVSCRVVSCRVVSCRVVSCRVVSCRVVSCGVDSRLTRRVVSRAQVLGPFPSKLLRRATFRGKYFNDADQLLPPASDGGASKGTGSPAEPDLFDGASTVCMLCASAACIVRVECVCCASIGCALSASTACVLFPR
jgi:hypothetical protein